MIKNVIISIIMAVLFVYAVEGHAMRCKGQLILEGDSVVKAIKYCGEPNLRSSNYMFWVIDGMIYKINYYEDTTIKSITYKRM